MYCLLFYNLYLQKVGILISRIADISGRKSEHFQIVVGKLSMFGIKREVNFKSIIQLISKQIKLKRKQAFV